MKAIVNYPMALVLILLMGATGCSTTPSNEQRAVIDSPTNPDPDIKLRVLQKNQQIQRGDPEYQPVRIEQYGEFKLPTGSLFEERYATSLYQYNNNFNVGDMILVQLDERTLSEKSLAYQTDKSSDFEIGKLNLKAGPINVEPDDLVLEHEQQGNFNSSAGANQSNYLAGKITVYVKQILDNGNLLVAGEKWITLNKGREYIRLTGEIRKRDVSSQNTISSEKIGNASIEYSGQGDLQDNQKTSVVGRLLGIFQ